MAVVIIITKDHFFSIFNDVCVASQVDKQVIYRGLCKINLSLDDGKAAAFFADNKMYTSSESISRLKSLH